MPTIPKRGTLPTQALGSSFDTMTTYTIIGATKGSPDDSQNTLAHFYQQTLATGARMAQGDGTGLGLVVWANAIGVENAAGFAAKIETAATAARTLTLPDAAGTVVLGNGAGITSAEDFNAALGTRTARLASDFATDQTTAQAVTGFTLSLEASTTYHLRAVLRIESASVTACLRPIITGPGASLDYLTAIVRRGNEDLRIAAFDTSADFSNSEGVDLPEIMTIEGIISINSTTPASDLGLSVKSSFLSTEVTLLTDSILTLTKLN